MTSISVYAYNFYEKVEETLMNDNKVEEYEKFQNILKNFDHAKERVSSLFYVSLSQSVVL
jgi:hypothetical protein